MISTAEFIRECSERWDEREARSPEKQYLSFHFSEYEFKAGEVPLQDAFPRKGLACGRSGIFSRLAASGETSLTVETVSFLPD